MKKILKLTYLILLITVMNACNNSDSGSVSPKTAITDAQSLTEALESIYQEAEIPGFGISIVKNDQLVYQNTFGYADIQNQIPYTNTTIQELASISKTFVGAAVVKAIELGYFNLDTDINDILPIELINPKAPGAIIQVKHLVTHTSGLVDQVETYLSENYYILPGEDLNTTGARLLQNELGIQQRERRTLEEFLGEYFLEDGDLYSEENFLTNLPGANWNYSNTATGLAAYLIELASGQSFDDFVKEQILLPLSMHSSTYDLMEVDQSKMSKFYLNLETEFPLYGNDSYPEGNLYTTNEDMAKYLQTMMKGARGESSTLFSKEQYDLLLSDLLPDGLVPVDFADNYGIFWYKKNNKIMHGGNSFGVSTYLEFDQSGEKGYVLLTNADASFSGNFEKYNHFAEQANEFVNEFLNLN